MSGDIDKINEIFRIHDQQTKSEEPAPAQPEKQGKTDRKSGRGKSSPVKAVDDLFTDKTGEETHNYTGDVESERDYHPVRQSQEYRSGCMGGIMYFVFIACVSVVLACLAWMAASDMLALNKKEFTAVVTLPMSIFQSETVDTFDENGNKTGTKRVTHADMDYVTNALKDAGLIEYKWFFKLFGKVAHAQDKIGVGTYQLNTDMDYRALIVGMHNSSGNMNTDTVRVTIPEGYTVAQTIHLLAEKGVNTEEALLEAAATYKFDYTFIDNSTEDISRLEGYLFPDTYDFYVNEKPGSALNRLISNFNKKLDDDLLAAAEARGYSLQQIVTIASLIEKETDGTDQGKIASVIYNRLEGPGDKGGTYGMLQIDASLLYALPDHSGSITNEDKAVDSPYNLYKYAGLPPTPIANPGLAAIQAALEPETTD